MTMPDDGLHIIALIKGVCEGDKFAHFASLLGFGYHANQAVSLGLLRRVNRGDLELTDEGRGFYDQHRLAELPEGRATSWLSVGREIVEGAATALGELMTSRLPEHMR
jgi:hypothetical protein